MKISNQFKYIAANLLSEVNDALDDVREGVLHEVTKEAHAFVDGAAVKADAVLQQAQLRVLDVKAKFVS